MITDYIEPDTLVIVAAALVVANVILVCVYRQFVKKEMDKHGAAVSQYIRVQRHGRRGGSQIEEGGALSDSSR